MSFLKNVLIDDESQKIENWMGLIQKLIGNNPDYNRIFKISLIQEEKSQIQLTQIRGVDGEIYITGFDRPVGSFLIKSIDLVFKNKKVLECSMGVNYDWKYISQIDYSYLIKDPYCQIIMKDGKFSINA